MSIRLVVSCVCCVELCRPAGADSEAAKLVPSTKQDKRRMKKGVEREREIEVQSSSLDSFLHLQAPLLRVV